MRSRIFLAAAIVVLVVLNLLVWQKERVIRDGRTVLLELAPVDPRSLMQGDYMRLRWRIESDWGDLGTADAVVVAVDARGVARFVRAGSDARTPDEQVLRLARSGQGARVGPDAWYFQEGQAEVYARARYGELRCDAGGGCVLVGLRDERMRPLRP